MGIAASDFGSHVPGHPFYSALHGSRGSAAADRFLGLHMRRLGCTQQSDGSDQQNLWTSLFRSLIWLLSTCDALLCD